MPNYSALHYSEKARKYAEEAQRIRESLSGIYKYKGSVATFEDLPSNAEVGDVYDVREDNSNYAWTGTQWDSLGSVFDLSGYATKEDLTDGLATKQPVGDYATKTEVFQGLNEKQDISTAVNYNNITNCITEIPQDIKLELNNGTLTLKAGSKVYVPNGAGKFDVLTISSDKTITTNSDGVVFINAENQAPNVFRENLLYSGNTAPTGFSGNAVWYNTTNNVIKNSPDAGSTWGNIWSFPLAKVSASNGTITSIDQVFNGFGYIGSTVFALPGVKGLIPNGRNEDGTLKNKELVATYVRTVNVASGTYNHKIALAITGIGSYLYAYDAVKNAIYRTDTGAYYNADRFIAGDVSISNGKITSFQPKTPFHAVDYNDFVATEKALQSSIDTKQDIIQDLSTIRSGASKGATAVQPVELARVAKTGEYGDLKDKPTIPRRVSELVNDNEYITAEYVDYVDAQIRDDIGEVYSNLQQEVNTLKTKEVASGLSFADSRLNLVDQYNMPLGDSVSIITNSFSLDTQVSNCITKIPDNLKLGLDTTTHLYQGSKVYYPMGLNTDGSFKFIEESSLGDAVATFSSTKSYVYFHSGYYGLFGTSVTQCYSGASEPANPSNGDVWYDTTNNYIKRREGSSWTYPWSFPLCIVSAGGRRFEKVFEGFGYIGSVLFVLPGVESLLADGWYEDGTLKSISKKTTKVTIRDEEPYTSLLCFFDGETLYSYGVPNYFEQSTPPQTNNFGPHGIWYNPKDNFVYKTDDGGVFWNKTYRIFMGSLIKPAAGSGITSMSLRGALRLADYNDVVLKSSTSLVPVGTVISYAPNSNPSGYLICNGAAVSRTTYADLFAKIGTTYGSGDGSTTFNIPNLTSKFIQGSATAGAVVSAGLPDHTHRPTEVLGGTYDNVFGGGSTRLAGADYTRGSALPTFTYASASNSIYGASTTVQPPAVTMRFYIKY